MKLAADNGPRKWQEAGHPLRRLRISALEKLRQLSAFNRLHGADFVTRWLSPDWPPERTRPVITVVLMFGYN